jgi:S-adenosylmethionine:tRNA ribosyltransferase-isomerase
VNLSEFDFVLPEDLIAQHPLPKRDQARMMVVWRETHDWEHRTFSELPQILTPKELLVLNNTRVFPARLWARRPGNAERIEILLTRQKAPELWLALVKPARKAPIGQFLEIAELRAQVTGIDESGRRLLRFDSDEKLKNAIEAFGEPPLPPYIHRSPGHDLARDRECYQTVYARHSGSVAAPTAGLHFSPEVLQDLQKRGIQLCEILLHIGYGTFKPVRCEKVEDHRMESEFFEVTEQAAGCIQDSREQGRRLIAVGTTTTRTLEYLAGRDGGRIRAGAGECDLFIYPGYEFRIIDALLTNFHLPKSTLFMLACAFGGHSFMLECYREAIRQRYRFFSYGDCMLIL